MEGIKKNSMSNTKIELRESFPTVEIHTVGATTATGVKIKVFNSTLKKIHEVEVFDNGDIRLIGNVKLIGNE